jgi:predicted Rossmann fold flavoprotein
LSFKPLIAIIGGGAAGYFAAIQHKTLFPDHEVIIFEKTSKTLGKVKISGGGRCNVTHACFDPKELVRHYPRGARELLGPFHRFQPGDLMHWFESRGVDLKIESDGRVFPVSDKSQTIIDCLESERIRLAIRLELKHDLRSISKHSDLFTLEFENDLNLLVHQVILTVGSSEKIWAKINELGHSTQKPVPSLFTFHMEDPLLRDFPGVSWPMVAIDLVGSGISTTGPLLITHWGLSGPSVLKLSAFAARELAAQQYQATIRINFLEPWDRSLATDFFKRIKSEHPNKKLSATIPPGFTTRIWESWLQLWNLEQKKWQELAYYQIDDLVAKLVAAPFQIRGKSTFKEEFVTCGGIDLKMVNMKTMESKLVAQLFFAGEVLDIDAVTGGFNFQAAWTTGWLAGSNDVIGGNF